MRRRPAPSADRIAISRLRSVARASSRFATLAHAIRSTKPTAPSRISSAVRTSLTTVSLKGTAVALSFESISGPGNFLRNSSAESFIAALAWSIVTPGRIRAAHSK